MKQIKISIFISILALFFMQCTVTPSKRSHDNAIGIWVGWPFDGKEDEDVKPKTWILGVDLKHLNNKSTIWDLYTKTNTVLNFNSGFHFGERSGMNAYASYYIMTDDLNHKGQFYIGPTIGINYISINDKPYKCSPITGFTLGGLLLIPEFKHFPESNIAIDGSMNLIKKEDMIVRYLYHVYVF